MNARTILRSALTLVAALLLSVSANAQLFRAYLAPTGVDTNPCTLPAPCRLLPAALAAVADGGEIWMLDSANYNTATVTIAKSVSILAVPGAVGSVLAIGGPAISISANNLKVGLRNLVIVPLAWVGAGTDGVSMTGSSSLTIEDSLIANLPDHGVYAIGAGKVKITNTTLRDNKYAVVAQNGANVSISGAKILGNLSGSVLAYSTTATTTTAVVSDTIISGGSFVGISANTTLAGGITRISVTRCTIEATDFALDSVTTGVGTAIVSVSSSMITNNNYAWEQSGTGSVIESAGNNHIRGNTNAPIGVLTPVSLQ